MAAEDVDFVAERLESMHFARGRTLIDPQAGPPTGFFVVGEGLVEAVDPSPDGLAGDAAAASRHLAAGDLFPLGALLAGRPVRRIYRAGDDSQVWRLERAAFEELTARSPVFLDFCRRRLGALLDLSNDALQASYAAQAGQRRSMEATIETLIRRPAFVCAPGDRLGEVLARMERESVGSVAIVDPLRSDEPVVGMFTRQDVIGRVLLPGVPLDTPIAAVMSSPVLTLDGKASVADAILMMAERSIRHLPVIRDGELLGVVTERDLFVLQRRSLRQIGDSIRHADTVGELRVAAQDIRKWSQSLVAQGVLASFITRVISRLNDQLSCRLIGLVAARRGVPLEHVCWLALGSEGREEQTIATDQDNGLIVDDAHRFEEQALLAFAREVNEGLDACGYPLCKGGIMASNPKWCLPLSGWQALFDGWIDRGDPQSLLNANIFFDFRALTGDSTLASALRERVTRQAANTPRFLKQMTDNALRNSPPPSWAGGLLETLFTREESMVDLKLNGTAPFVDGARVLVLAGGVRETGTAERLQALAAGGRLREDEVRVWVDAFQFLQSLRLRAQHRLEDLSAGNPNLLDTRTLSEIDRQLLRDAFRQARRLQQRLALDHPG